MSRHRFYLPGQVIRNGAVLEMPPDTGQQIARVLRLRPGDEIVIFDGTGPEWTAEITSVNREAVSVIAGRSSDPGTEPSLQVTVCQALVPSERMEFVIQKGTELGAVRFVPITTERVQSKDSQPNERRLERWKKIATEAAEQSGRTQVPDILPVHSLESCVSAMCAEGPVLLLWEEEMPGKDLRTAVRESLSGASRRVAVLVGPVGGLSASEVGTARDTGAIVVGAGPRILRAETAPVVALAALMYEAGELK